VILFVTSICNAKCRTCFYWQELNRPGDLTWDELRKISATMPPITDLWLSGGEPFLRKELVEIVTLFCRSNGVRWVNLPTNGLLPQRVADWTARILRENPELRLDLNVALDGLGEVQDSIRGVPGNFQKTLETIRAIQPVRREFRDRLRANLNTVICAENYQQAPEIAEYAKTKMEVDGHYFNIIRGEPMDGSLKQIPAEKLPALYRLIGRVARHYSRSLLNGYYGTKGAVARVYYEGTLAFHHRVQLANYAGPHPWPMECTAGQTICVIDYNGDVRACELRRPLGNLRDFGCDFSAFWASQGRREEPGRIAQDGCWCTHVCFIHDSLRHSKKALLWDVPISFLSTMTLRNGTS